MKRKTRSVFHFVFVSVHILLRIACYSQAEGPLGRLPPEVVFSTNAYHAYRRGRPTDT